MNEEQDRIEFLNNLKEMPIDGAKHLLSIESFEELMRLYETSFDINQEIRELIKNLIKERLESKHGKVYDTDEMRKNFKVKGFLAPFVEVVRVKDGARGTLMFQHMPRFYFNFEEM